MIRQLAAECHDTAKEMGFYDLVGSPYEGFIGQVAHMWKQVSHLFIEAAEAEASLKMEDLEHYREELCDVAIVLMDLFQWLGVPLSDALHVGWGSGRSHVLSSLRGALAGIADTLRKEGINLDRLAIYGDVALSSIYDELGGDFKNAIRAKLARNRQRGHRYGVHDGEGG